jgi:glutamyl-tRNA reductase
MGLVLFSLQRKFEGIRQRELRHARHRLSSLTGNQQAAVESITQGIVNAILRAPLNALTRSLGDEQQAMLNLLIEMFNLECCNAEALELAESSSPGPSAEAV